MFINISETWAKCEKNKKRLGVWKNLSMFKKSEVDWREPKCFGRESKVLRAIEIQRYCHGNVWNPIELRFLGIFCAGVLKVNSLCGEGYNYLHSQKFNSVSSCITTHILFLHSTLSKAMSKDKVKKVCLFYFILFLERGSFNPFHLSHFMGFQVDLFL